MFQIVRVELNQDGHVVARWPLQPLYDLRDDAMALAEFDASRCAGWWARDHGRSYRFVIEEVAPTSLAS
jgi:hypothetical protein